MSTISSRVVRLLTWKRSSSDGNGDVFLFLLRLKMVTRFFDRFFASAVTTKGISSKGYHEAGLAYLVCSDGKVWGSAKALFPDPVSVPFPGTGLRAFFAGREISVRTRVK